MPHKIKPHLFLLHFIIISTLFFSQFIQARDLAEIKADGVLRHIGVTYANFITQDKQGDKTIEGGLDVELMQGFAEHIGVQYEYVEATWANVFTLLNGESAHYKNGQVVIGEFKQAIAGDVIANGATILEWRKQVVDFSDEYFPSAVWLIARSDSMLTPITPGDSIEDDIIQVKELIKGVDVMAMKHSCLDPDLYNLDVTGANVILPIKARKLNEMIPAILNNDAESTLLDVPDTLIALQRWPGEIKVIGPISDEQRMAVAFRKNSPELRHAFNLYLRQLKKEGTYNRLVKKYYPSVFHFYDDFFQPKS
ncbi:ABC transporter substrate-binding protein [Psychromonas marina]|uniref:ABC transporter substrate-binding protein n=1 Tax=Psychromonas marina TaxID=88364 RepID=A0ABQ6E0F7_9GAMM|nr:transporter substrate-binding domain-containing protein [Psychromonas marina]GLS90904.1 ABC transporter substrate-binding protein [Psychromonas marina]